MFFRGVGGIGVIKAERIQWGFPMGPLPGTWMVGAVGNNNGLKIFQRLGRRLFLCLLLRDTVTFMNGTRGVYWGGGPVYVDRYGGFTYVL